MPRIVSLIASATEIVCALGFEDHLVGISHECDFPPSIRGLPVCTAPKFSVEGNSGEIDERVKKLMSESTSVYRVDGDLLQRLNPEVIITQAQCEVCAVSLRDVEKIACDFLDSKPAIVSLEPNFLEDVWRDMERVGGALQDPDRTRQLLTCLKSQIQTITSRISFAGPRPRVACLEWLDPLMAAGNWIPELVTLAGGEDLFGTPGSHSPWISLEDLVKADPDVIIAMPCGFDLGRTEEEFRRALNLKSDWHQLRALKTGKVFMTDGNQYFNRPGPRLVDSLGILAQILHPVLFPDTLRDLGWRQWQA